jgi:hypothetical protein
MSVLRLEERRIYKVQLTVGLDHLSTARTTTDKSALALPHGELGILILLFILLAMSRIICMTRSDTYCVLAKGERHAVGIATNLNKDSAVLAELANNADFEGAIVLGFRKTKNNDN